MPTPNNMGNAPDNQGLTFGPAVQQDTHVGGQPAGGGQSSGGGQPNASGLTFGEAVPHDTQVGGQASQPQPDQPGLFSRAYEETLKGPVDLVKGMVYDRPVDLYHQAVEAAQKGDWKSASESANKLLSMPITAGLNDKDSPLRKAATAIIMQPVNAVADEYKAQRKQGQGKVQAAASTANNILNPAATMTEAAQTAAPRIKADAASGNYAGIAGDIAGAANSNTTGAIPVIGSAVRQVSGNLDQDLHAHNYSAVVGDILGPLLTFGAGKVVGALGDASEAEGATGATTGVKAPPVPATEGTIAKGPVGGVAPGEATVAGTKIPVASTSPVEPAYTTPLSKVAKAARSVVQSFASPEAAQKFVKEQVQPAVLQATKNNFTQSSLDSVNELRNIRGDDPATATDPSTLGTTDDLVKMMKGEVKQTYSKLDQAAEGDKAEWDSKYGPDSGFEGKAPPEPKSFTELQDQLLENGRVQKSPLSSQVDKAAAKAEAPALQDEMAGFLNKHGDVVNPQELAAANRVYAQSSRYAWIADKLRTAIKGTGDSSLTTGLPDTIAPGQLKGIPAQFDNHFEPGDFEKLLGKDGMDNFKTIANLLETPKAGSAFIKWLNESTLKTGKLVTGPAGLLPNQLLFNPRVGQLVDRLWNGAKSAPGAVKGAVKTTAKAPYSAAPLAVTGATAPTLQQQQQSVMSAATANMGESSVPKTSGGIQDLGTPVLDAYKNNPEDEPHDKSFQRNKPWSAPGPYVTSLSPKDEAEFQKWAKANPKLVEGELNTDTPDYDVRGRWLADKHGDPEAKLTRSEFDGTLHASDKWKTPYDAVFSRESKYATPDAPRWVGDKLIASNGQVIVDETPPKKKQPSGPLRDLSSGVIAKYPFSDSARQYLNSLNYQPRSYQKESIVPRQGGEYDIGTKNVYVDTSNPRIPQDQQQLVMAHEMLNALYPLSPAYKNSDQFNKAWENLKTTGNKDVRQQLQDVDTHLKRLGYDKLGTDAMNSSRFSYLAHDALTQGSSWIPKQLMPYYKGIVE